MPLAPEEVVSPPTPQRPMQGLVADDLVVAKDDDSRWEGGFGFKPESCGQADVWVPCGAADRAIIVAHIPGSDGQYQWVINSVASDPVAVDADAAISQAALLALILTTNSNSTARVRSAGAGTLIVTIDGYSGLAGGFTVQDYGADPLDSAPSVSSIQIPDTEDVPPDVKSDYAATGLVRVDPFIVEAPYECSTFGMGELDGSDFRQRAIDRLAIGAGQAVEEEFWTGAKNPNNPNLRYWTPNDDDHVINDGGAASPTAVSPSVGLSMLEAALSRCGSGARGAIHGSVDVISRISSDKLWRDGEGNLLTAVRGDRVIAGSGYGFGGPFGQDDPEDGHAWLFATGAVQVRLGDVMVYPDSIAEALDRGTNTVTFRAEQMAAVTHDGCCMFAVYVELDQAVSTSGGSGSGSTQYVTYLWDDDGEEYELLDFEEVPDGALRIFIGPNDPEDEGFTLEDGDLWFEVE